MEEQQNKTAEEAVLMEAARDGLGHFQLKLGMLKPDMTIEEQLQILSKYHDIPSVEAIKNGETQLQEGYINDFFIEEVKQFFKKFPKAYDLIGEKNDDIMLDYAALGLKYHLLSSGDRDKAFREKAIKSYYDYLPKYESYLLNLIQRENRYDLTQSSNGGLDTYVDLNNQHESILSGFEGPLASGKLINEVMTKLFPKINLLKDSGISEYYYNRAVSDMIIGKFKAYVYLLAHMAKGGPTILHTVIEPASEPLGISGIYNKLVEVEASLTFDEDQRKEIAELKTAIETVKKGHGGGSDNSGCFGTLLLLATAASGLLASLILIF